MEAIFLRLLQLYYIDRKGKLTDASLNQGLKFLKKFAKQVRVDKNGNRAVYNNPDHFKFILKKLDYPTVANFYINYWDTKINTCLKHFNASPTSYFLRLIDHFDDFQEIRKIGLTELDFPYVPNNTWKTNRGNPTNKARRQVFNYLTAVTKINKVRNPFSEKGFKRICPNLISQWKSLEVNHWGNKVDKVVREAYGNSISLALKDLILHVVKDKNQRKLLLQL